MLIKRRSKPRRGRVVNREYLAFVAEQPCIVSGERATVHHVRTLGSPKDDTRTLPLAPRYHLIQCGPESIEALGKKRFQELHGVDLEAEISRLQELYARVVLSRGLPDGNRSAASEPRAAIDPPSRP